MNPLACTKCAGRLLMALAAITSILSMAACGSGGSPPPPTTVGFTDASLTGTYVFSAQGIDSGGAPLALAGTFVTVGTGTITGGTIDVVDAADTTPPSPIAQTIITSASSYRVGTDGRGQATLNSSAYGTFTLDFVLTSSSHGLVTEFDGFGTGSGTLDLQTAVTSLSQLAGPYAFSLAGTDVSDNPFAAAGAFTLNSSGTITTNTGTEDFNDAGSAFNESLTGAATLGSGTGPLAITLTTSSFPLTFDLYPIDATHWKLIETDTATSGILLAGDVFTQTGASIPNSPVVFTMGGATPNGPIANGGLMNSDGAGGFSSGLEDYNNVGTAVPQVPFSGIPVAGGPGVGGRVVVNLTGFVPNVGNVGEWVIYPSSGGLLMLEADSAGVTLGAAFAQKATSFTAPGDYGLNLTGADLVSGFEVDDIAEFSAQSGGLTGSVDINDGGPLPPQSLGSGSNYIPDSPATGRGSISTAAFNLEYYTVDASTALFIDIDSNPNGQVAVGTFEAQSSSGAGAAARSRMSIVHPTVRPRAAMRRK